MLKNRIGCQMSILLYFIKIKENNFNVFCYSDESTWFSFGLCGFFSRQKALVATGQKSIEDAAKW